MAVPTVLRWDGYRAFFYSNERHEPPHVHVKSNDREAKFWLENLELVVNYGFSEQEIKRIRDMLQISQLQLQGAWKEYFGG
jgi:hypothetical protein